VKRIIIASFTGELCKSSRDSIHQAELSKQKGTLGASSPNFGSLAVEGEIRIDQDFSSSRLTRFFKGDSWAAGE